MAVRPVDGVGSSGGMCDEWISGSNITRMLHRNGIDRSPTDCGVRSFMQGNLFQSHSQKFVTRLFNWTLFDVSMMGKSLRQNSFWSIHVNEKS